MTTLPATLWPDLLDAGVAVRFLRTARAWHGPTGVVTRVFDGAHTCLVTSHGGEADGNGEVRTTDLSLDLTHWTGRAQLARVLAAGLLCPDSRARLPPSPPNPNGCRKCNGTGYLRKPSDVRHLLPVAEMGTLPDAWAHFAPALLKAHAESVAEGGVGVVGVLGESFTTRDGSAVVRLGVGDETGRRHLSVRSNGWWLYWDGECLASGPETGPEGKRLADLAALAHNFALIDSGGLRVGGGE